MATPCASCGRGLLQGSEARSVDDRDGAPTVALTVTCNACRTVTTRVFQVPTDPESGEEDAGATVNPTDEASRILDVGQWIMLFRMITETAGKETDKTLARHLGLSAAQCLEEALKFYDETENDLPPPEAFFIDATRERFRNAPEQFSRRRLLDLRAKLPSTSVMRSRLLTPRKKPWWRRLR